MRKRKIVRLQLFMLFAVLLLLLYRVVQGPPAPRGIVVFTDIDTDRLRHAAFQLTAPDSLVVVATGAFGAPDELAAYAWMLRRDDRSVAWAMDAQTAHRGRGALAEVTDTLALAAGTYDVYFTSFGNRRNGRDRGSLWDRLSGGAGSWRNDSDKWMLVLRSLGSAQGQAVTLGDDDNPGPQGDLLLWTSAPTEGYEVVDYLFDVRRPARLRVYAVGEIDETTQMDYGWVENALTGERVWEMTRDNTQPAGGWDVNRMFDGELALLPGIYRAAYRTDARQSFEDWVGNPPFDPAGWGLSLFAAEPAARADLVGFDPWASRQPIAQLAAAGDDVLFSAQLDVRQPVRLLAYAVGEIGSSPYDYAWLKENDGGERVWEMSREASQPAGGDDNNRVELAFLSLDPGSYTLYYQTDGSHAYGDWLHGEPEHPERWGVTLFPAAAAFDTAAVQILSVSRRQASETPDVADVPPVPDVPEAPPALGTGVDLLEATRLGAEARKEMPFQIEEQANLHIYALGEISLSGRYDYGWIEHKDTGEIVWEMTWQNTKPAGSDDRNRLFDGVITLPPGRYAAHFRTDFSHNYGDFGDRAPANPEAWGITIEKL